MTRTIVLSADDQVIETTDEPLTAIVRLNFSLLLPPSAALVDTVYFVSEWRFPRLFGVAKNGALWLPRWSRRTSIWKIPSRYIASKDQNLDESPPFWSQYVVIEGWLSPRLYRLPLQWRWTNTERTRCLVTLNCLTLLRFHRPFLWRLHARLLRKCNLSCLQWHHLLENCFVERNKPPVSNKNQSEN